MSLHLTYSAIIVTSVRRRVGARFDPKCSMKHPTSVKELDAYESSKTEKKSIKRYLDDILNHEMKSIQTEQFLDGDAVFRNDNAPRTAKVSEIGDRSYR